MFLEEGCIKSIDAASVPVSPDNKKGRIFLLVGFISAIIFGVGVGFYAEYADTSFREQGETEDYLEFRCLRQFQLWEKER